MEAHEADIGRWLEGLGLGQYEASFRANAIDAATLPHLTADDLKELGVTAVGHRRRLLDALAGLVAPQSAASPKEPAEPKPPAGLGPPGEWRQVAVLFADLCGYTALSRELDAEAIHALLGRFFACADSLVEAHGGRVDKHIGDCVMAVFGAPVAHGNDAERAIAAALAIKAAMPALTAEVGRTVNVHLGVAEGRVVASATGSASHHEYTVTGETVNLAARLVDTAGDGEILVADGLWRRLAHRLDGEEVGTLTLKGFAEPIRAWRLTALVDAQAPALGLLVGRPAELAGLEALLAVCKSNGRGQVVVVRGEAGIGKTRLVEELRRRAAAASFDCHTAQVLDFGTGTGRDAVRALARSLLGLAITSPPEAVEAAASEALDASRVAARDADVDAQAPFLNDLLDLPQPPALRARYAAMDAQAREMGRRRVAASLVTWAARARPQLLIIEDMHWVDPTTLKRVAALAAATTDCPALLVLTSRIEGDPLDQAWRSAAGEVRVITIDLGRLSRSEASALAHSLLSGSAAMAERCVERAAGNPLFLEQLLRHANDTIEAAVPGTVQSLVQARLDRLPVADRLALQAASVLGQRFVLETLAALLSDAAYRPDRLIAQHLLRHDGEGYSFAHALIRDAVYDTLLSGRRGDLHGRAAIWFADRDAVLEAEHLDRADRPEAAAAYLRAARQQAGLYRFDGARQQLARGLELATESTLRFALARQLGELEHDAGNMPASLRAYEMALTLAQSALERCHALIGLAAVKRVTDDLAGALVDLDAAQVAADGRVPERARIHFLRGNLLFPRGDIAGVLHEHQQSLELARACGSPELEAAALGGLGDADYLRGRMRSAHASFSHCVALAARHGFGRIEVANRPMIAIVAMYVHGTREALVEAERAIDSAERAGHGRAETIARHAASIAAFGLGDHATAERHVERALALARQLGAPRFEAEALGFRAELEMATGRADAARVSIDAAIAIARRTGMAYMGPAILGIWTHIVDDPESRAAALAEAEALLAQGAPSHNHFLFRRAAIEACLAAGEGATVLRLAADLEAYAAPEPCPWVDYFVARARVLVEHATRPQAAGLAAALDRLVSEGQRLGQIASLTAIQAARAAL